MPTVHQPRTESLSYPHYAEPGSKSSELEPGSGILPGMRKFLFGVALGAVLIAPGCKPGKSLQGDWDAAGPGMGQLPPGSKITMSFGGTDLTIRATIVDPTVGTIGFAGIGTYKLDGEKYTHEINTLTFDTSKIDAQMKAAVESQLKPDDLKKQLNQSKAMTVKFNEDGTVSMTGDSPTNGITLTKQK